MASSTADPHEYVSIGTAGVCDDGASVPIDPS